VHDRVARLVGTKEKQETRETLSESCSTQPNAGQGTHTEIGAKMNEWKALTGRLTFFPLAPTLSPAAPASALYRQVWRAEPENFLTQPNALLPSMATGRRGALTARCLAHPSRVDFDFSPSPPREPRSELQLIEDTSELHTELSHVIEALADFEFPNGVSRIALYLQFLSPKSSSADANSLLCKVIPSEYGVKIRGEEDFVFQVNRPYLSRTVEPIKMNSLTKWSADRIQLVTLSFPAGGQLVSSMPANPSLPASQIVEFIAASVAFDINSVPSTTPLANLSQSLLLTEALASASRAQVALGLNVEGFRDARLLQ